MSDVTYKQNINLSNYELRNAKLHIVAGLPVANAGNAGWVVFNSADGRVYVSSGNAWSLKASDSDLLAGQNAAYYLARGNHTGDVPAANVSGFAAAVQALQWRTMLPPTAAVNINSQKLTSVLDGTADSDAATFGQLKALVNNQDFKASVKVATPANQALTGLANIDGQVILANDRILVPTQTDPIQNGIYLAAAGAWVRADDANTAGELSGGVLVPVEQGALHGDTIWMLTTNGAITPGVTANTWIKYGANPGEIVIAGAGLTKTGVTLDIGAGAGILVGADSISLDPAYALRKVSGVVGTGSNSLAIAHNLGTKDVHVSVYETLTGDEVLVGVTRTDNNTVTLNFAAAPAASGDYRYVIFG